MSRLNREGYTSHTRTDTDKILQYRLEKKHTYSLKCVEAERCFWLDELIDTDLLEDTIALTSVYLFA